MGRTVQPLPIASGKESGESRRGNSFVLSSMRPKTDRMNDHVYKKIELVGSSPKGIEDAVANALTRASKTIRNMRWFEITETRGHLEDGKIAHWQVTVSVGFTLDA